MTGLRERKVVQWLAAYAAAAWVVFEVTGAVSETWTWPPVVARVVFVLLAAGVGVTAIVAWFHGEKGHQKAPPLEIVLLALLGVSALGASGLVLVRAGDDAAEPLQVGSGVAAPAAGTSEGDKARRSVLVLPFADLSPDGGSGYLGDGIAETLINGLGRVEELRVVARTSAFAFRESGMDVREIARRVNAGTVLEGSVVQAGGQVRISASLFDAETGLDLWSEKFDRETETAGLFDLQDEVAQAILEALAVELGTTTDGGGPRRVVEGGTASQEAQRTYFLGLHHWTARTTEDMILAARYFNESIAADSSFADAWAGLALSYSLHTPSEYRVPGYSMRRGTDLAIQMANRALELDPDNAAALTALGDAMMQRGEWGRAESYFREAIAINPGYAGAHHWLGDLLMIQRRGEEALGSLETAESLSPVAPAIMVEKASALLMLGRTEEAMQQLDRALATFPDARLIRGFATIYALAAEDWERIGESLRWTFEDGGSTVAEAEARAVAMLTPETRIATLRRWQRWPQDLLPEERALAQAFGRPELRVLTTRLLDGGDAALDVLEEVVNGPDAEVVYGPMLPAILGPELSRTSRAAELIRLAYLNRQ